MSSLEATWVLESSSSSPWLSSLLLQDSPVVDRLLQLSSTSSLLMALQSASWSIAQPGFCAGATEAEEKESTQGANAQHSSLAPWGRALHSRLQAQHRHIATVWWLAARQLRGGRRSARGPAVTPWVCGSAMGFPSQGAACHTQGLPGRAGPGCAAL
eukprot:CAMPEP_0195138268 /NCGR_PEP_ID=MMETSP0448-20130528/157390_1 /TAXON_ID=66468 /ORGANISM="Heterocapsa triquestra, Strain CCMP 448" /LENGTH=156 /DNA_ID=CAMNT_0040176533 /DNA_START=411 /DNA_END=878 /DNA_ORIENTATION=+